MSAGDIRAGKAYVEVTEKDQLTAGLKRISERFKNFAEGIRTVGDKMHGGFEKMALGGTIANIFSAVGLGESIKAFTEAGSELDALSKRTGMTVEGLGKLKYAANFSSTSMEAVSGGVRRMERFMGEAAKGTVDASTTLAKLGLSYAALKKMSPDQQFQAFARAVAKVADPTRKAALAMQVFGKGGQELVPMLNNLEKLSAEAEEFGVMSAEDAKRATEFDESLRRLKGGFKGIFTAVAGALVEDVDAFVKKVTDVVMAIRNWVKDNKQLVRSVVLVGAGVAAAGTLIMGAGAAFMLIGSAFGGFAVIAGVVGTAFSAIIGIIGAILSPIGLVVAAVVGLGGYLLYSSGLAGKAFDFIKSTFESVAADCKGAFGAIGEALSGGDLGLAAQIAMGLLRLEFSKGVENLYRLWDSFKEYMAGVWDSIKTAASPVTEWLSAAWETVKGTALECWAVIVDVAKAAWDGIASAARWAMDVTLEAIKPVTDYFAEAFDAVANNWDAFCQGFFIAWENTCVAVVRTFLNVQRQLSKAFAWLASKLPRGADYAAAAKIIDAEFDGKIKTRDTAHQSKIADLSAPKSVRDAKAAEKQREHDQQKAIDDMMREEDATSDSDTRAAARMAAEERLKILQDAAAALKKPDAGDKDNKQPAFGGVGADLRFKQEGGTFSANAAARMGGSLPVLDRVAAAAEATEKNTRILRKFGMVAFA